MVTVPVPISFFLVLLAGGSLAIARQEVGLCLLPATGA